MVIPTGQDYSPNSVLTGSLPGAADSDPECFTFSATVDTIAENSEDFSVVLQSTNNIMMFGSGAINVGNDEVTITIDES